MIVLGPIHGDLGVQSKQNNSLFEFASVDCTVTARTRGSIRALERMLHTKR